MATRACVDWAANGGHGARSGGHNRKFGIHRRVTPSLAMSRRLVLYWAGMPEAAPSQSAEDYLERIHELIQEKGYARVVDIASSLKITQASVTSMVQKLGDLGFLNYEKYRGLILTEKGLKVAAGIQRRHETLSRFFSLFGLDAKTQQRDIEGIEHHLSPATVEILSDLADYFEHNPESLQQFKQSREGHAS
jgi:Mn-dependent DtxR family transcriptional regulator